ncbi:unnamed protein product [Cyprideis torosa]|uniref:Uncharacterized protein n=1 Tax=Cyprideis torosa TaxID=163714 RepID=A0A7R8ZMJ8_9CRUS|nr:unnamed protein product [Cyprideis torosa]CAG0889009.1 unnamed protein product [Cyprideis torosa]
MLFQIALGLACLASSFAVDPYSYSPKPSYGGYGGYSPKPSYGGYKEVYPDVLWAYISTPSFPVLQKPYYNFGYTVKDDYSGNYYGHEEKRDGYETQGAYQVLLPDGRTQTVSYTANEYGYNADVKYDGYPKYDSYKAAPYKAAPSYHTPKYVAAPSYGYSPKPSYGYSKPSYGYSKPSYGYSKPSYGYY